MAREKKRRWWVYPLALLGVAVTLEAALFTAVAVQAGRLNNPKPADVMIVLGARIYEDASPSPALQRRLDLAFSLYDEGYAGAVITTGAQGEDEPMPEADAMRAYLVAQGIPEGAVFSENASFNTAENLQNAQAIMEAQGFETAIIVTSDYHLWRALSMCGDIGLPATGAGSQNALTWPVRIRNMLQETLSWVKYALTQPI